MQMLKLTNGVLITDNERIEKRIVVETDYKADEVLFYVLNVGMIQMSFKSLSDILGEAWTKYYEELER